MKVPKVLTDRQAVQTKIYNASEGLYKVAKAGYGPRSGNVLLGFKHGAPLLSHDGVTNIKQVRFEDSFEDDVAEAIKQVSERLNQKVGDTTTGVVILSHHLLTIARRLEGNGLKPVEIIEKLKTAEKTALDHISKLKKATTDELLVDIATVSVNDKDLGAMIADVMIEVGKDGGVVIEQYEGLGVHNELIDGFYFPKGFKDVDLINDPSSNQSLHSNVPILISNKTFNTEIEIAPVLNDIARAGYKEIVIVGEVNNLALETLKMTRAKGVLFACVIEPPYTVGGRSLFLEDIAVKTGGKVYNGVEENIASNLGFAKEVLVTEFATTILDGDSEKEEVEERLSVLRKQLEEEEHPQSKEFIRDRIARLSGKMAVIRVGGAIELVRDKMKLAVQDAVCAVQSGMKDGVLPGGGVALATVKGTAFDEAFQQPFKDLMDNAGLNPEAYLSRLENAKEWEGFNLWNVTDKPVDLLKEGVLDTSIGVTEMVTNAVALVSDLINTSAAISHPEKE